MNDIPCGYCHCGCGGKTSNRYLKGHNLNGASNPSWNGGRIINSKGYIEILMPEHPRAGSRGYVPEHILVAEKAFGKPLPPRAVVHHANGTRDSGPLIICEDENYHRLLHQRLRAFKNCGHPSYRVCKYCKKYDDPRSLIIRNSHNSYHALCKKEYDRQWRSDAKI